METVTIVIGHPHLMADIDKPKPEPVNSPQDLWNTYRQMMERDGIDLGGVWLKLIAGQIEWLSTSAALRDFEELCEAGCAPLVLASITGLIRLSPRIENSWNLFVGDSDKRRKTTIALEKAAAALEDAFRDSITVEDENQRHDFAKVGCLPPSRLVSQTRLYASMLNVADVWAEKVEVHSLKEFTKYLFVGYVNRATGSFCDRTVSGLIGEVIGPPDYDEVALRMWRSRNYRRLDNHLSWIPDLLLDMGNDIARLT
jgi:hypothetical protein